MTIDSRNERQLEKINARTVLGAGFEAFGQLQEGFAAADSTMLSATIFRQNKNALKIAAEDSIVRGQIEAQDIQTETAQLIGEQRAQLAANGIVLDQDTALDVVTQTRTIGATSALTALANAEREAAAFLRASEEQRVREELEENRAGAQRRGGFGNAVRTVLGATREVSQRLEDFGRGQTSSGGIPVPPRKPVR